MMNNTKMSAIEQEKIKIESFHQLRRLLMLCCIYSNVWPSELNSTRESRFIIPKRICCALARKYINLPLKMIAHVVGLENHATIIYHAKTAENLLTVRHEEEFRLTYQIIDFKFKTLCLKS